MVMKCNFFALNLTWGEGVLNMNDLKTGLRVVFLLAGDRYGEGKNHVN